jgi:two-component system sensor histidine kinase/response regulator
MISLSEILSYLRETPRSLQIRAWGCAFVVPFELSYLSAGVVRDYCVMSGFPAPWWASYISDSLDQVVPIEYAVLSSMILYIDTLMRFGAYHTRRSRMRLRAINKSSAVARFTPSGHFLEANKIFCSILDARPEDLIGEHHSTVVPAHLRDGDEYAQFWASLRAGEMRSGLFERVSLDGRTVWIRGTYHPILDDRGQVMEVMKVANDETSRVQDQIKLQTANTYLEHAAKILRHDMHSGINTYIPRGLASLRRRISKSPEVAEAVHSSMRMLEEGLAHTQRVYRGVTAFTDLVRPNTTLRREPHKLDVILKDYLESTAYSDQVLVADLPEVEVNEPLFCTAVDNFIRNGLKYNDHPKRMVTVFMEDAEHLAVQDNGRGLTQEEFDVYSKPYVRKQGQAESGTGLGLNISLAILREHGFLVTCNKRPEGGTKILIRLAP